MFALGLEENHFYMATLSTYSISNCSYVNENLTVARSTPKNAKISTTYCTILVTNYCFSKTNSIINGKICA